LQSANVLEICGGLLAATSLITADMVPAMSGEVTKLLNHDSETVRKKAIICLHKFHQLDSSVVTTDEVYEKVRKVLCDRDPAVMGSCLNVICRMSVVDPVKFKDLIPSLVSILKQIGEHRLPNEFDYHRVPAPWMQIRLVRILSLLGQADAQASSGMYEILFDTMKKADVGINAGYAIVYECIKCITKIYPNAKLLDAAADAISRFIQSRSHNLKYLGVTGLAMIVETHPQYAAQHQMSVMDCLEDADETLQRKTLDLLYRMTNPVNVEFITEKLVDFLRGTTDLFLKQQLTTRVCSVAERYAPNNAWYIQTITTLFEVSGDMVDYQVAQNLMSLIAEGTGESDEADMMLRQTAIELYVGLLVEKPPAKLPKILLETMAWCLGEYAYLSVRMSLEDILTQLCQWNKAQLANSTRKFLTSAIFKLVAQAGTCPPQAANVVDQYTRSKDVDLQQRCLEFQNMLTTAPQYLGEILPIDASAEDVDVDASLSFLDAYCQEALANGARPYSKPEDDDDDDEDYLVDTTVSAFKMTPYAKPDTNVNRSHVIRGMGSGGMASAPGVTPPPGSNMGTAAMGTTSVDNPQGLALNTRGVANVWGKKAEPPPAAAAAAAAAAPPPTAANNNPYGAAPQSSSNPYGTSSSSSGGFGGASSSSSPYGGGFGQASAPAPIIEKTREQLEKERMAAALFGGMVPGAPPPPPKAAPAPPAAAAPPPPPAAAAPPVAVAPPPVEIDLLDMGFFDDPAPAPASSSSTNSAVDDIFGSSTMLAPTAAAPAPAAPPPMMVETASDDEQEAIVVPSAAAPPATSAAMVDPFAAEGLLSEDTPLKTFERHAASFKFEYNGNTMAPLAITTPQFGPQWGSCPATSPVSLTSQKVTTLEAFMKECTSAGLHPVEAIGATNEAICAGTVGAANMVVLIHAKLSPIMSDGGGGGGVCCKLDITVKSTDATLSGFLALYLQNMMK
jgi:AP-4 complex subunit epsilon-1